MRPGAAKKAHLSRPMRGRAPLLDGMVVPTLISQTIGLIKVMPQLTEQFQTFLGDHFPSFLDTNSTLRRTLASMFDQ